MKVLRNCGLHNFTVNSGSRPLMQAPRTIWASLGIFIVYGWLRDVNDLIVERDAGRKRSFLATSEKIKIYELQKTSSRERNHD